MQRRAAWPLVVAFFATLAAVAPASTWNPDEPPGLESSVVKVYVRSSAPNPISPWQKTGPAAASGSGVIIDGHRILTAAHVVEDYVSLEVKRAGMTRRYPAEVIHFGHQSDLALLSVEDERFFEGATPVPLGDLAPSQLAVDVYGFPVGGDTISVTSGIVSRVEVSAYAHSREDLLLAQIDAAINSGNSGGPVMHEGTVVGIAVQSLDEAENVGYMVPSPVIGHFLDDVADGRFDGSPRLGIIVRPLESDTQRASLGMEEDETGALVTRVSYDSTGWGVLQPGDVVLALDGTPVANDLTVPWPTIGRVHMAHLYRSRQVGDTLSLAILRDGQKRAETITLRRTESLVPGRWDRPIPKYLVLGGLVFRPLTVEYLALWGDEPPFDLATYATTQNIRTPERQEVLVLSHVLPSTVNRGYQDLEDLILATVDGQRPRDLVHLAKIFDEAKGRWLVMTTEDGYVLTLDVAQSREASARILTDYGLSDDRSPGVRAASPAEDTPEAAKMARGGAAR